MMNDTLREKLVAVANLLADLTGAVAEIAAEFGEVKVEEKKEVKEGILGSREEITRTVERDRDLLEPKKMEIKKTEKIEKEI